MRQWWLEKGTIGNSSWLQTLDVYALQYN
jgi:hypothetical protein